MSRWWVFIDGKRQFRSVTASDTDSAHQRAIDRYQIEPARFRIVAIKPDSAKPNPRDQLDDLWRRRPELLV